LRDNIRKILYILPNGDSVKIAVLFLLMLIAAGLEVIGIGMIPAFVSIVSSPDRVLEYEPIQPLIAYLNITTAQDLLIWGSVALVGIFVLKSIYTITFNYIEARFIYNRRYRISHRMMSSYMQAPYTFHLQRNSAELLRNITTEVYILINKVLSPSLTMAREGIMALSILLFLLLVEPLITLVVMGVAGLTSGTFLFLTRKKAKEYGLREQNHRKEMIKAVNQGLGGIKDARVLNREAEFVEKFRIEARDSSRLLTYITYIKKVPHPVIETTAVVGMLMIAGLLVWQDRPMEVIIPVMTLFAMAIVRLMPAIKKLTSDYTYLIYSLVALDPVYEDLRELNESSRLFLTDRKKKEPLRLENKIDIKDLHYRYPETDEQALNGISLTIPRGKAVAFVGESGAGKTTIVDLLLGLLKPARGLILVDGKDIQDNLSGWQQNIGYIPQSIYLADESLRRNIAFGLPDKEIDEEKINLAVELAQLKSMVERMPDGLDTILGEHGTRISGGQRQRVGIARALYHDPQVLVMDEATSALDNITEKEITNAIENLRGDRTIIMIAHRLTTVENCDQLYLMKDGVIVDSGNYEELVDSNAEFRRMALVN
jgi:ATP-binding cassette, subfamily B, bacterial PglK